MADVHVVRALDAVVHKNVLLLRRRIRTRYECADVRKSVVYEIRHVIVGLEIIAAHIDFA